MNNKKRLEFIKQNYFNNKAISLLPKEKQEEALLAYATGLLEIVPKKLYKYRICNDNNINILRKQNFHQQLLNDIDEQRKQNLLQIPIKLWLCYLLNLLLSLFLVHLLLIL